MNNHNTETWPEEKIQEFYSGQGGKATLFLQPRAETVR